MQGEEKGEEEVEVDKTEYAARVTYSEALQDMCHAREFICKYSFEKARERVKYEAFAANRLKDHHEKVYQRIRLLQLSASAVSEQRPMTKVRYDPCGNYVAVGSLSSQVKIWDAKTLKVCASLVGHQDRITSLAWHPQAHLGALATLEQRPGGSEGHRKRRRCPRRGIGHQVMKKTRAKWVAALPMHHIVKARHCSPPRRQMVSV